MACSTCVRYTSTQRHFPPLQHVVVERCRCSIIRSNIFEAATNISATSGTSAAISKHSMRRYFTWPADLHSCAAPLRLKKEYLPSGWVNSPACVGPVECGVNLNSLAAEHELMKFNPVRTVRLHSHPSFACCRLAPNSQTRRLIPAGNCSNLALRILNTPSTETRR